MPVMLWSQPSQMEPRAYICGHCGKHTGPNQGYVSSNTKPQARIYICTYCGEPTYFDSSNPVPSLCKQYPGAPFGDTVASVPPDVGALYDEARQNMTVNSFTSAVLACRKLLMHIAVEKGAPKGGSFLEYVEFLAVKHYVPPDGQEWVDQIRKKGNEANHEIKIMSENDAKDLITFSEMLLKFIYEFPSKVKTPAAAKQPQP